MATNYSQQKQKVLQLFQRTIAQAQHVPETRQRLSESAQRLTSGTLTVVVCGEFKQGKSSLLNALLDEQRLFPVDVDITTNLVSTISYGNSETISVVIGSAGQEKMQQITRPEIPDYVTEQRNPSNSANAKLLAIQAPNPKLKEGLALVDTPGVGSLNVEHTAISYTFIPNADAILFVSDAFAPLTTQELTFLQDRIIPHCQTLIFVVTKIDAVRNYQEIVASNREKLSNLLSCAPEQVQIVPVSSRLKLEYLRSHDAEDLEDSNFADLEQRLWTLASQQRGSMLLIRALAELGKCIGDLRSPLEAEWQTYQQTTQQELMSLQQQHQDAQTRLQNLLDQNATWRSRLIDGLQDLRTQMSERFQDEFLVLRREMERYLDDARLLSNPDQIISLLEADLDSCMSTLGQHLSSLAGALHGQLEALTDLDLNPFEVRTLQAQKGESPTEQLRHRSQDGLSRVMQINRSATFTITTAGTIGGVLGSSVGLLFGGIGTVPGYVIGGAIGTGIAALGGAVLGARDGLQQAKDRDKQSISLVLRQFLEESQMLCNRTLSKAIRELELAMRDELTAQIKREKETCDRTLRAVQEAQKLNQTQAAERSKTVKTQIDQLTQLHAEAQRLAETTAQQTHSKPSFVTAGTTDYGDWADD